MQQTVVAGGTRADENDRTATNRCIWACCAFFFLLTIVLATVFPIVYYNRRG